jgi:hypothetical protein
MAMLGRRYPPGHDGCLSADKVAILTAYLQAQGVTPPAAAASAPAPAPEADPGTPPPSSTATPLCAGGSARNNI